MHAIQALTLLAAFALPLSAQTLHYRTHLADSDSTLWRAAIGTVDLGAALSQVVWRSESGDSHREVFRIEGDGNTRGWAVSFVDERTDYVGRRLGDTVSVRGVISGTAIQAVFEIDSDPVFVNIPLSLAIFVRSGHDAIDFWTFRAGDGSMIHMDARREAVDTLSLLGVATPAVRVRWAPKGWRGLFYSRRFWFRASDGVLLQTDVADGRVTVLTGIS